MHDGVWIDGDCFLCAFGNLLFTTGLERSGRKLKITEPRIITVTGKAFFDINHAPADQSNRRTDLQGYAAWEIHPVMKIDVQ